MAFSFLQNVQTLPSPTPAPSSICTAVLSEDQSGQRRLVPQLGISGAIPLLHLYAFLAWTGTTLPFLYKATAYSHSAVQEIPRLS